MARKPQMTTWTTRVEKTKRKEHNQNHEAQRKSRISKWYEGDDVAVVVVVEEGETEDLVDRDDCNKRGSLGVEWDGDSHKCTEDCCGVESNGGSDGGDKHNWVGDGNSEQFKREGHGRRLEVNKYTRE